MIQDLRYSHYKKLCVEQMFLHAKHYIYNLSSFSINNMIMYGRTAPKIYVNINN